MNTLRNKYIISLIILNTLLALGLLFLWRCIYTDVRSFVWTNVALSFLFLYEITAILTIEKKRKTVTPRQSVNLFLVLKVGKIILSLFFVMAYALAVKIDVKRFALVFAALYFVYLLFDTIYLAKNEKRSNSLKS